MRRSRTARGGLAPHLAAPCAAANMMDARAARISPTHARNFKRGRRRAAGARDGQLLQRRYVSRIAAHERDRGRAGGTTPCGAGATHHVWAWQHEIGHLHVLGRHQPELRVDDGLAPVEPGDLGAHGAKGTREGERHVFTLLRLSPFFTPSRLALQLSPTRSSTKHFVLTYRQNKPKIVKKFVTQTFWKPRGFTFTESERTNVFPTKIAFCYISFQNVGLFCQIGVLSYVAEKPSFFISKAPRLKEDNRQSLIHSSGAQHTPHGMLYARAGGRRRACHNLCVARPCAAVPPGTAPLVLFGRGLLLFLRNTPRAFEGMTGASGDRGERGQTRVATWP